MALAAGGPAVGMDSYLPEAGLPFTKRLLPAGLICTHRRIKERRVYSSLRNAVRRQRSPPGGSVYKLGTR